MRGNGTAAGGEGPITRALGAALGLAASAGLVWFGVARVELPVYVLQPVLALAFLGPGLVLMAMIGWNALARLGDRRPPIEALGAGGRRAMDARIMAETAAFTAMAVAVWPALASLLANDGPGVIAVLGPTLALARLLAWIGAHVAPPLRAFGFAASYFPTVLAALWAGAGWLMRLSG